MRKALYVLGQLTDSDVEWMVGAGRKQSAPAGTTLIRQGRPIDSLFIVLEGTLSVVDDLLGGKELARLAAGEIVGEMSFVDSRPPSASVKALEPSILLALPQKALSARLNSDLGFGARFYRAIAIFLSDRLRGTVKRLGYGDEASLDEETEAPDELDLNVLDNVHLAGARFDYIQKRFLQMR